jgi:deoxyhypusine synthase
MSKQQSVEEQKAAQLAAAMAQQRQYHEAQEVPAAATLAVMVKSEPMPEGTAVCMGYDWDAGLDYKALLDSYASVGFQATNFGHAVREINRMRSWRLSDDPVKETDDIKDPAERAEVKTKIFFSYTSNMISCGIRETILFLAKNNMVDVLVTTAGGIEEDFVKCLSTFYIGEFKTPGKEMRLKGRNRTGNLVVPNENYCLFEDWLAPILDQMLVEQKRDGVIWTPSKMIHRLGKEIDNPKSVYYWCYKNNIPVFSPAITDGSIGDMLYFMSYKNPGLVLDLVGDIRLMNDEAVNAKGKTGMIILGGGLIKHHVCNANLMRNGADFSVMVNTAHEFDGSDSGARPDEAKSWGKIKLEAEPVKIYAETTLVFPLLVAQTFAQGFDFEAAAAARTAAAAAEGGGASAE